MRGAAHPEYGLGGERVQVVVAKKVGGWGCGGADLEVGPRWRGAAALKLARRREDAKRSVGPPSVAVTQQRAGCPRRWRRSRALSVLAAWRETNDAEPTADLGEGPRWRGAAALKLARRREDAKRSVGRPTVAVTQRRAGCPRRWRRRRVLSVLAALRETNDAEPTKTLSTSRPPRTLKRASAPKTEIFSPRAPGSASGVTPPITKPARKRLRADSGDRQGRAEALPRRIQRMGENVQRRCRADLGAPQARAEALLGRGR